MVQTVTSRDGTRIAYECVGAGPPVIMIGGMFCDRNTFRDRAEALADTLRVVIYDRRGRGESGDTQPYAVAREIEDLEAVISQLGGRAAVYGHSSGAGLALEAAASGLAIDRLVLHDPPYGADDEESISEARTLAHAISEALAQGRPGDAISAFLLASGAPAERARAMAGSPALIAIAHTMPYDMAVMGGATRGRVVPVPLAKAIAAPTLLLVGERSGPMFQAAVERLSEVMPAARVRTLAGTGHEASAEVIKAAAAPFLANDCDEK